MCLSSSGVSPGVVVHSPIVYCGSVIASPLPLNCFITILRLAVSLSKWSLRSVTVRVAVRSLLKYSPFVSLLLSYTRSTFGATVSMSISLDMIVDLPLKNSALTYSFLAPLFSAASIVNGYSFGALFFSSSVKLVAFVSNITFASPFGSSESNQ